MTKLKDKIKTALDETRMLMLGAQILLGFQYRNVFEPGFERLPSSSKYLKLVSLTLLLIVTALLMSPGAYHRLVEKGEDTEQLHEFTTRVMDVVLLPFALALGIDIYVATGKLAGSMAGALVGSAFALTALSFWYVLEFISKPQRAAEIKEHKMEGKKESDSRQATKVKDKIDQALTEARVVLPGAQALLGFQFVTMFMDGFDKLPASSKYAHLISLILMAISVVFLMTPAAYHRIVEQGEETEHFHRVTSYFLLAAMMLLPTGISGDFFVVLRKVTESTTLAAIAAALMLVFFYGLWFGFTVYRRSHRQRVA